MLDQGLKIRSMILPDEFIDQDKPERMYAKAGLDATAIMTKVFEVLQQDRASLRTLRA
jgi:1-deoxy-D-xylulose-5-phosphate synthase